MSDILKPRDAKDVEAAVAWAIDGNRSLDIVGAGTKRAIGRPAQTELTLDLSALSGVTLYEPNELVLSAKAGTPMAEIEALLTQQSQELAFEPPDYGAIFTGQSGAAGTLGGAIAANLSGPRRIKSGAARDHFLGVHAVSGRGESFKSGGRVVKNVTGYDLCKLLAGSWGTLAAMTELTVKVLPRAECQETLLILGLADDAAIAAMSAAMGSAADVSGAAHLPAAIAARIGVESVRAAGTPVTALRLEGVLPSIEHRRGLLESLLGRAGTLAMLRDDESRRFWREVRDVGPFAAQPGTERPLWRISVAPTAAPRIAARIAATADAEQFYDWAGGLVWVAFASADDGGANVVRSAVAGQGHATLIRAPAAIRAAVPVFEPPDAGIAMLSKRVKDSFDPKGLFNPGRMYSGV